MDYPHLGLFDVGGGTLYDVDEDLFIEMKNVMSGGKFKNPIEKAEKMIKEEEENNKWLVTKGPAELAKYMEKYLHTVKVIQILGRELVEKGIVYNENYQRALQYLSSYQPVLKAYSKLGYENMGKETVSKSSVEALNNGLLLDKPSHNYFLQHFPINVSNMLKLEDNDNDNDNDNDDNNLTISNDRKNELIDEDVIDLDDKIDKLTSELRNSKLIIDELKKNLEETINKNDSKKAAEINKNIRNLNKEVKIKENELKSKLKLKKESTNIIGRRRYTKPKLSNLNITKQNDIATTFKKLQRTKSSELIEDVIDPFKRTTTLESLTGKK